MHSLGRQVSIYQASRCRYHYWRPSWGVYTLPTNVFKIHVLMLDVCWIV